jgi:uncharacterized protein CbrC (UPF0167 family)
MKISIPTDDLPITLKLVDESYMQQLWKKTCQHRSIIVDTRLAEVECADCQAKLNPVAALAFLMKNWEWINRRNENLIEAHRKMLADFQEFETRKRMRCQHCGKLTLKKHESEQPKRLTEVKG